MSVVILKQPRQKSHAEPRPVHVHAAHVFSSHAAFCIKCVSVGQHFPRHMQRAHAAWLYQRISCSNKRIQLSAYTPANENARRDKEEIETKEIVGHVTVR